MGNFFLLFGHSKECVQERDIFGQNTKQKNHHSH
jgi:hypothetical protein